MINTATRALTNTIMNTDHHGWSIKGFYQTAFDAARKNRVLMPKFEQFWQENKPITFKASEKAKKWVRYEEFRNDPLLNPLGTTSE